MKKFHWLSLMGRKFFRVAPNQTIFSIVFSLISKLTSILVSYLPLKVVILLGSSGIPKFFPASFQQFDRETLVISLCAATVIFYMIYLASEKLLLKLTEMGAGSILINTRKMPLFDNQQDIAQKGFQRYSQSLAELFFLFISVAVLAWIYPSVLVLMVSYGIVIISLYRVFFMVADHSVQNDNDNSKSTLMMLFDVGYLLVFVFMIYQAINGDGPSILIMILTFILIRQFQGSLKRVIINIKNLVLRHVQINALFFDEHVLVQDKPSHEDLYWTLTEPSIVQQWVGAVIEQFADKKPEKLICQWMQLDVRDILVYRVSVDNGNEQNDEYLIKLFGKKQTLAAQHESEIMLQISDIPSLELLAVDEVQGFQCLLFDWKNGSTPKYEESADSKYKLNESLIKVIPPSVFIEKYLRSHPLLSQRLDQAFWQRVEYVSHLMEDNVSDDVEKLIAVTTEIKNRLNMLPLTVINPKLSRKMLSMTGEEIVALHWGLWAVEPMGAGWSIKGDGLSRLATAVEKIRVYRRDAQEVKDSDISLAASVYAFEQLIKSQKFSQACDLIPSILSCLDTE